jgi:hypothetical protein
VFRLIGNKKLTAVIALATAVVLAAAYAIAMRIDAPSPRQGSTGNGRNEASWPKDATAETRGRI